MEKNKVLLTDKVTKENIKSPSFKRWVMRVLCFACILSLALQLAMCVAPLETYAAEHDSIVGTWVFNDTLVPPTSFIGANVVGSFNGMVIQGSQVSVSEVPLEYFWIRQNGTVTIGNNGVDGVKQQNNYNISYGDYGWKCDSYLNDIGQGSITADASNIQQIRTFTLTGGTDITNENFITWLNSNATKVVETVYDFTGEYRIFKPTLSILFTDTAVVQSYNFDFNVYGGYNADYLIINSQADRVTMSYSFTDEGSGGLRMVYRQGFDDDTGTWLVPRARVIYFQSNPDDPTFQQWLLDNTYLVAPDTIDVLYDFGYQNGYNDGWTNNVIGDTLNAPLQALNNMVLLQTTDVTVTMGGVIVAMISLSILIVFLKKYAGG